MAARLLIAFLFLASLLLNLYFIQKFREQNRVVEVVDGDTFQLSSGKRVRLMGVDAPEINRCGGDNAHNRLKELLRGKIVTLKEEMTEAYGRSLALVYVDGMLVNKIILEEGWGRTDYRKNSSRELLTQAFHTAQNEKRGIFSSLCVREGNVPSSDCQIKGNIDKATNAKIYHLPNCRYYDETILELDRGEQFFCTEAEAQAAGFHKASSCQ